MKRRILFVDDEPRVLQGLRRMLRSMRDEWEMAFAGGGQEALDILSMKPFDVVVTDMRMPGMDGAKLLSEVLRGYPQIVRIVLSGHSEREMILKAVQRTHQYLSKPCDADALKSTVARACALRDLLADDSVKGLVSQMQTLPSLPSLYAELMEELLSEEASIRNVGKIISKDVGMSAKILQIVNSAFFGRCRHVSSPMQAASLLGLETIRALVVSVHVFSQFSPGKLAHLFLDRLWKHSMAAAAHAAAIASEEDQEQDTIDDSFIGGLLHDTGKVVLAANFPKLYGDIPAVANERKISVWEVEREVFRATHCEVGAYLMGLWGLPDQIVEALAFHHCPHKCPGRNFSPLTAVHVGDVLEQEDRADVGETVSQVDVDYLRELGVADRLDVWRKVCREVRQEEMTDG